MANQAPHGDWAHRRQRSDVLGTAHVPRVSAAGEGIATNILSGRLKRLEEEGIIRRARSLDDGRAVVYALTDKGLDLAPVLVEMVLWAARHERTDAPPSVVREMRTRKERFISRVRERAQR